MPSTSATTGSRLFIAPELLEGKPASVQADLYSLGVMLYQLAVGDLSRALAPGWRREVNDEVLSTDIAQLVDGRPEHRPADARQVAARLRALDARRDEREAERRKKLWQRRRRIAAAIAAVFLVVFSIVALQAVRGQRESDRLRGQSDRMRGEAEELIDFMLGDLQEQLQPIGRLDVLEGAGEKALEYFDSLQEEDVTDSSLAFQSKALNQFGDVRMAQGDLDGAMEFFEHSLSVAQALSARDPENTEWLFRLGQTRFWVGAVNVQLDDLEEALSELLTYLEISEELVRRDPDNTDWLLEVAYGHTNVADVLTRQRTNYPLAFDHYEKALAISGRLVELDPANRDWCYRLVRGNFKLGRWIEDQGSLLDALASYRQALDDLNTLLAAEKASTIWQRQKVAILSHAIDLAYVTGDVPAAIESGTVLEALCNHLFEVESGNDEWQGICHSGLLFFKRVVASRGEAEPVADYLREFATSPRNETSKERSELQVFAWLDLGYVLLDLGRIQEALVAANHMKTLAKQDHLENPSEPLASLSMSRCYLLLGDVLSSFGDTENATKNWETGRYTLAPHVQESLQGRVALEVWISLNLELGRIDEVRDEIFTFLGRGYREPRFLNRLAASGIDL